ncbi:acyl-CoA dehydrogenase [Halocatena marina]|uniref:Acyl-CoA dehydrogenase n=1 Tax=Halocatena marina TaxID=2934937 RepID=A0ABD5YYV1_9EURY|nr:acyl-CoA dehydrogenase [Halocatena marina]
MSSFKSGSGNLNFGEAESDEEETSTETTESETSSHRPSEQSTSSSSQASPSQSEQSSDQSDTTAKYPYFVRRGTVGDERENRLELFVRDKVAEQEATFRNELAEELGVDEIAKTDAREFALLAAYQNPKHIAECMREEGFGELN